MMQGLKTQLLISHFWFLQACASLVCTWRQMCLHVEYAHLCPGFSLTTCSWECNTSQSCHEARERWRALVNSNLGFNTQEKWDELLAFITPINSQKHCSASKMPLSFTLLFLLFPIFSRWVTASCFRPFHLCTITQWTPENTDSITDLPLRPCHPAAVTPQQRPFINRIKKSLLPQRNCGPSTH